jgi:hypothetical protein
MTISDQQILKSALAPTKNCLRPEQLEALVDGKTTNPHLAECPRCQAELALLKSFESTAPLPNEGAAVAWISAKLDRLNKQTESTREVSWFSHLFGTGRMRWMVPAGAVLAIGIAVALLLEPGKAPELRADISGQPAAYRSIAIEVVSPRGELAKAPDALQWKPFAGTDKYKVELMEVDHSLLWSYETTNASAQIPDGVRSKMLPGKPILWQVTSSDAQNRILSSSQVEKFVVVSSNR